MDMSFRDWLVVAGLVVLVVIVLDGLRRMHRARRDSLEIAKGMGGEIEGGPLDDFNPELPNGGARVVQLRNEALAQQLHTDSSSLQKVESRAEPFEPYIGDEEVLEQDDNIVELRTESRKVGSLKKANKLDGQRQSKTFGEGLKASGARVAHEDQVKHASGAQRKPAQEIIVINVFSRSNEGFNCGELLDLFDACGLNFGDMSIFHRHEEVDTSSPVQFSVANAVVPGVFYPDDMEDSYTPGVSFFMSLPGPSDNMLAFECMLATAQCVVKNLNGEMKDEKRSDLTVQTIEHCRQRIKDFERKQLSVRH